VFLILQIAAVLTLVGYLAFCRIRLGRRNRQSWESLVARLRPAWGGHQSNRHYLGMEGITVGPEELWANIAGPHGIWTLFTNTGVMLEMAEFAERNCETIDPLLVQRLRSDALQIRKRALGVLLQCAMQVANETVCINAFQVASMYNGMASRMVALLQQTGGAALPEFVAAM
jgi:hypothetical protein